MITGKPLVLIADDDPVSLAYLRAAIERCGCAAIAVADAQAALLVLQANAADLLVIDRRMPVTDGVALLRAARNQGIRAPAIASSAELEPAMIAALHAAGFADTLLKPASLATIRRLLQRFLALDANAPNTDVPRIETSEPIQLLDDAAALTATGGDREALSALRRLFIRELDAIANEVKAMPTAAELVLGERLHRLRASCGFCGAAALGAAALRLEQAIRVGTGEEEAAAFLELCAATKQALAAQA